MSTSLTIATVALTVPRSKQRNLENHLRFCEQAAGLGASLVVFPELSIQGYLPSVDTALGREQVESLTGDAERVPGPSTELLRQSCSRHRLYVAFGIIERTGKEGRTSFFNTAVLLGPDGVVGKYRKIHLVGNEREIFSPGDELPVFSTRIGKIGMLICRDQSFPESNRVLALKGADLMVMIAAWSSGYSDRYEVYTRARAMENQVWYVVANQTGKPAGSLVNYPGRSRIINPDGKIVAETPEGREGIAHATIDIKHEMHQQRQQSEHNLRRRRPRAYAALMETAELRTRGG